MRNEKRATALIRSLRSRHFANPVGQDFVRSLERPGGNITGFTGLDFSVGEKWAELPKELAPDVTRVAYVFHPEIGPFYSIWLKSVEDACAALGIETIAAPLRAVGHRSAQPRGC